MGVVAAALSQTSDGRSSLATEVPGPSVGPSGQTGDLHYLENPGTEYRGGAEEFGPFRLLPPGTKFIERASRGVPATSVEEVDRPAVWEDSDLVLSIPTEVQADRISATVVNGESLAQLNYALSARDGGLTATVMRVSDSSLPLDVYRPLADSPLEIVTTQRNGAYVVIEQRRSGPAPSSGYVSIYADGRLLTLYSQELGQDRLAEIGLQLVQS